MNASDINAKVLAPVPWFPIKHRFFGQYGKYAKVPAFEERHGIEVLHPRFPVIPKIGMTLTPYLMARAMKPVIHRIIKSGFDFDLIDAHYFYPDGVAATILGRWFRKPVVITARGTDINLIPDYPFPRKMIVQASRRSAANITVSKALQDRMISLGISEKKITVLRNGVDFDLFNPVNKIEAQKKLNINGKILLSVGNLVPEKGHELTIGALPGIPEVHLYILGEGIMLQHLKDMASTLGVADRVHFVGSVPQEKLKYFYSAADALLLMSVREGMPNVVLESIACGTPVIATRTGGIPEVVRESDTGILLKERSSEALVDAVNKLFVSYPDREAICRYARQFSWDETTQGQLDIFRDAIKNYIV